MIKNKFILAFERACNSTIDQTIMHIHNFHYLKHAVIHHLAKKLHPHDSIETKKEEKEDGDVVNLLRRSFEDGVDATAR